MKAKAKSNHQKHGFVPRVNMKEKQQGWQTLKRYVRDKNRQSHMNGTPSKLFSGGMIGRFETVTIHGLLQTFVLILVLVFMASIAHAELIPWPTGYEAITVDGSAGGVSLTTAKYWTAATSTIVSDYAEVCLETAQIRFTSDGTTVTSSAGTLLEVGQCFALRSFDELRKFRAIRTGSSGSLKVRYYKRHQE